jgi:hypothetical protein
MSVDNFIPMMWSTMIQDILKKSLVFDALVNRDYEGQIAAHGDSVKINAIGDVTIGDYTKNGAISGAETVNDQSQILQITQAKYFHFEVDDIDKRQTTGGILSAAMQRAAYQLRDTADTYLAGLYGDAGTTSADTNVNSVNVLAAVLTAAESLNEQNVPMTGRRMIITPWFHTKLVLAKVLVENTSNTAFDNGFVGRCGGFDMFISNNVQASGGFDKIMAGTNLSITFADQINSVEAYRPELSFSDAVKGLHLYGAKVVMPDALTVLSVAEVAEP